MQYGGETFIVADLPRGRAHARRAALFYMPEDEDDGGLFHCHHTRDQQTVARHRILSSPTGAPTTRPGININSGPTATGWSHFSAATTLWTIPIMEGHGIRASGGRLLLLFCLLCGRRVTILGGGHDGRGRGAAFGRRRGLSVPRPLDTAILVHDANAMVVGFGED